MQQLGNILKQSPSLNSSQTSNEQNVNQLTLKDEQAVVLPIYTTEHKKAIGEVLGACIIAQRSYGRQGSDLQALVNIFCNILSDCNPEKVIDAIKTWMSKSGEFPTPADIRQIIHPEPVFSRELYVSIEKRRERGETLSGREIEYQKRYRTEMMKGL